MPRFYREMSYGEHEVHAFPKAHWNGSWYYCFDVSAPTPPHNHSGWYQFYTAAIEAADPEVDFSQYARQGEYAYVAVIAVAPGGASGLHPGSWPYPTNDTFPNGETVYASCNYGYRSDAWAQNGHITMNVHEYGHNWLPDTYGSHYNMGSLCGHWGWGFCQYHSWVDLIVSPINPQWRYEMKDPDTNEPWLIPTEIAATHLDYSFIPIQETYGGEVVKIRPTQIPGIADRDTQTFVISNHQNLAPFEINLPDSGLIISHVSDPRSTSYFNWPNRRRMRPVDIECAHGTWQWDSTEVGDEWIWWSTIADPIYGTDSLDMYNENLGIHGSGVYPPIGDPAWKGFGSATCIWDPEIYTRFDAFTNPSTDFYDKNASPLYPQYIHSHFALRNIHPDLLNQTIVRADILLNYIQSDVATATSYNNARKLVSNGNTLHMVYEAGGYIYYTKADVTTMIWEPAFPLGNGNSPSIALDSSDIPNIIWIHDEKLYWANRQNFHTWQTEVLYYDPDIENTLYTPSILFDDSNSGHIVFEKRSISNSWSKLYYGEFNPAQSRSISWELVDSQTQDYLCQFPSIAVNGSNNPHVVWQRNFEIYYRERDSEQFPPWQPIVNISNSLDLSSNPFVEEKADTLHVVWIEKSPLNSKSDIRHRRRDLISGLWYIPQWVYNSNVYSTSPQLELGSEVVWSEETTPGNFEIFHSHWNGNSWDSPQNVSNTPYSSTTPQVTIANDDESLDDYLITIWCEDDGILYEVRNDKRLLVSEQKGENYSNNQKEKKIQSVLKISPSIINWNAEISYHTESSKKVSIELYDISGRLIKKVFEGRVKAGLNEISFSGENLSSGVYFLRLETKEKNLTEKLLFQK